MQKKEQLCAVLGLFCFALAFVALAAFIVWDAQKGMAQQESVPARAAGHLPYLGMDERWIDECGLGLHDEEKAEMRSGRRATVYLWHAENGTADVVFRAVCTDGKVCEATKESRDRNYWLPGQELPDRHADRSLRSEQESPACSSPESPELTFSFGEGTGAGSSLSPQDFDSAQGYADAVAASGGSWDDAYTRWEDECGDG